MNPFCLKRIINRLIVLLFCNWSLHTKSTIIYLVKINHLQLMQKYRQKTRQMAKMSQKISHSTVCMLAFSAVVLATIPSGRHLTIAFFKAIKPCWKSKYLRGWQIYIINSQPFYIGEFMVFSITNLIRTANHTNAMVHMANVTCLASIVMSSMWHGLIASKKVMMGCSYRFRSYYRTQCYVCQLMRW